MFGFFEKRINPFPETRLGPPPRGLYAFVWHYLRDAWPWLVTLAMLVALLAVGEVMLFGLIGALVDWLGTAEPEGFLAREWPVLALGTAFLVIGLPLLSAAVSVVQHQVLLGNLPMSARWRMHRLLLRQSMAFYANEFAGRLATKVMQTSLSVREAAMKLLDVFVFVSVYFTSAVVMMATADLRLALPLIFWLVVYLTVLRVFVPRLAKVSERQADARSVMTGRIVDSYTNIQTVKLFAHSGREADYARESMDAFLQTVHPQMRLVTMLQSIVYFNNCVLVFLMAGLSILLWTGSLISLGAIAVGIALALRMLGMSQWVMWEVAGLFENIGVIYDGREMLTREVVVSDEAEAAPLAVSGGRIRFEGVCFHYGRESGLIDRLNLDIAPGEKVGLVGPSGAGKTTLMNLLLRFHDVEAGRVLIDGQDISAVTQESLRAQIGVVTQDTSLLHRSIRENIAYGRPGASDAEILEAARKANAADFIAALEDRDGRTGLDAQVGERGVKLSGGQRQRIAIARVFLKDAPILILDEATSALDSTVEAAIQENLEALMHGKTVIAIAHRLSTIAAMDRLIVLEGGRIVEEGRHGELVRAGGLYAGLWARQSGGFLVQPAPVRAKHDDETAEEMVK